MLKKENAASVGGIEGKAQEIRREYAVFIIFFSLLIRHFLMLIFLCYV